MGQALSTLKVRRFGNQGLKSTRRVRGYDLPKVKKATAPSDFNSELPPGKNFAQYYNDPVAQAHPDNPRNKLTFAQPGKPGSSESSEPKEFHGLEGVKPRKPLTVKDNYFGGKKRRTRKRFSKRRAYKR